MDIRSGTSDATLTRLGVAPEDAAEILRTMPAAQLLDQSRGLLISNLASRDSSPVSLPLPAEQKLFPVHVILASIDAIRRCHQEFGISDGVSWDTLSYLGRSMAAYRKRHGEAGIALSRWDWLRFFGWLYQAGSLEFTVYWLRTHPKEAGPLFWYDDRKGDPAIGVHVPAGATLTPEACDDAFRRMPRAFARVATCTSWLLDDQLAEYLPADSNIVGFQRRFELVPGARDNDEAILHAVFGTATDLDALPQRTTLERAVVQHLKSGRHWRTRTGWLALKD